MGQNYKICPCYGCKVFRQEKGLPEPINVFEAEINRVAELLLKRDRPKYYDDWISAMKCGPGHEDRYNRALDEYKDLARVVIAEKEKSYKEGFFKALDHWGGVPGCHVVFSWRGSIFNRIWINT